MRIPETEMQWRFSRSSGPGGQHVNTADTRVELTWNLGTSDVLTESQKDLARKALKGRLSNDSITLSGSRYRSQLRNREDARARLHALVAAAITPPKPRHRTRPSRSAVERRLDAKNRRSQVKRQRSGDWT